MTQSFRRAGAVAMIIALVAVACSGDDSSDEAAPTTEGADAEPDAEGASDDEEASTAMFSATIRRTEDGVVHVLADDLASVAFGDGYALAQDHGCDLADQIVKVRSERARFFGSGEDDEHITSDFAYLHLGLYDRAQAQWDAVDADLGDLLDGYTTGYNTFLAEVGADGFAGWCAGEEWVQPITPVDLLAYYRDLLLLASGRQLLGFVASAQPPDGAAEVEGEAIGTTRVDAPAPAMGSNGWAVGSERAEANGLLLGNPHFPWEGELRLWEHHLTVPGDLDVYGASLIGTPGVLIGFNNAVAWSHTVSAGNRFTAYRLTLADGDPTSYVYGDETRAMTPTDHEIDVLGDDGTTETVSRTLWSTHYGPVLDFPGLGWTEDVTLAYRDANIDNETFINQFLAMDRATSMDEFQAAHEEINAIPWVNTISVSADGRAWYADTAATPNLSDDAIARWLETLETDPITEIALDSGAVLLDGSDPAFEWVEAAGARSPGLVPFSDQPQLERSDYVFNANNSYWLANPEELLTGFSPLHGREDQAVTPRPRMNVVALEEGGGDDGLFTLDELLEAWDAERILTAELLLTGVTDQVCPTAEGDASRACEVLAGWDATAQVDSTGTALWRLFIEEYDFDALLDSGPLFATGFDPADPVGTPRDPAFADAANLETALAALGSAVAQLDAGGFALDVPWGDIQTADRGGAEIAIPGGSGDRLGILNAIGFSGFSTTLEPGAERGAAVMEGSSLTDLGWRVNNGSSFVFAVEFGDDGPRARARLTYGQSGDPNDPRFSEQTIAFSAKQWRDVRFTEESILADPSLEELEISA